LTLSTTSPSAETELVMIGAGRSPTSASPTTWYVDIDPNPWVWNTTSFPDADITRDGFTTSSTKTKRWGTNVVDGVVTNLSYVDQNGVSYTGMRAIITDFDQTGGTPFESQAVRNDSGSGLFIDNGSGWELAGTIVTVGNDSGQPGGTTSAIFGNLTVALDLSAYADEINGLVPEPNMAALFSGLLALAVVSRRRKS
jgi:hypothetical protein